MSENHSLVPSLPAKIKVFLILSKNSWKTERISLKYFVNDCLQKPFFDTNSPQTASKLTFLRILVNLTSFTLCSTKIRAFKLQKSVKICLTW